MTATIRGNPEDCADLVSINDLLVITTDNGFKVLTFFGIYQLLYCLILLCFTLEPICFVVCMSYMMTLTSPKFHLLSESGLRVGYPNVYHLLNEVPDISSFLNNEHPCIHLLGLSETRLDCRMSDEL